MNDGKVSIFCVGQDFCEAGNGNDLTEFQYKLEQLLAHRFENIINFLSILEVIEMI